MGTDFWIVLQWWGTLFLVGAVAYPLTKTLFGRSMTGCLPVKKDWIPDRASLVRDDRKTGWWDGGYLFSKAVGMAVVTWIVFVMGTVRLMPFSVWSIGVALGVVFLLGIILQLKTQSAKLKTITQNAKCEGQRWIPAFAGMTRKAGILFLVEAFFFVALLFWSWIKGHEPSIRGLEKFMDYGFMQSILNAHYFPPADMWYAPLSINYYYFGHMVTAVLTKLSGLDLGVTFNLMLVTIFALTLTMSFSIGYQLSAISSQQSAWLKAVSWKLKAIFSGLLTAFLVTLAGNMQTIYAFTRGYTGENVKPFWELGWKIEDLGYLGGLGIFGIFGVLWGKLGEGMNTHWYPNATRFIPFTIHEFPSYSFVVSDVHGHVLSIPFVLLAIALLIQLSAVSYSPRFSSDEAGQQSAWLKAESWKLKAIFYGFLVGVLLMTNALDGPIYFALALLVLVIIPARNATHSVAGGQLSNLKKIGMSIVIIAVAAIITSLPFLVHFKSFVTGVAVNCPLPFLANMKFGPILFEGMEKCQRSPLWMWWLLWGFFVYCGVGMIYTMVKRKKEKGKSQIPHIDILLVVFFVFALVLVIVPEFIYFKDIYPAHFRSNTMFKLGYEAFILFSIVSAYSIVFVISGSARFLGEKSKILNPKSLPADATHQALQAGKINPKFSAKGGPAYGWKIPNSKQLFLLFLLPQLILVSIYPIFSVRSYFNSLKRYEGLDGLGWLRREYPDDWGAIEWLNQKSCQLSAVSCQLDRFAIVEADGDSYTDYARFSAFTGRPTVIGWAVHEWLWRGTYDVVAPRREEVRQIYESEDVGMTASLLNKYSVHYVIVGKLEREKFKSLQEWKFAQLGREIFRAGGTVIYEMKGQ